MRRLLAWIGDRLRNGDPYADRGTGRLERCHSCGESRRDVTMGECMACFLRKW